VATVTLKNSKKSERFSRWVNRNLKWVFSAPAMIFVALLLIFPLGWTLYLSFTNSRGSVRSPLNFVGFENYSSVLTDTDRFWPAVGRTVFFTGGALFFQIIFGIAIALLLWKPFKGQRWVRVAILLPLVATPVAIGMMWRLILEPSIGFANEMLSWVGIPAQPWLASPSAALTVLTFIDVWQWTPMVTLIVLAGLTAMPEEPDEAARVDGASGWQRLWYVTLPLLRPSIIAAALLRGIDALKTFDILYATKGKGGGSFNEVETLNIYAYGLSFDYNRYGQASTVLVLFFLMIIGLIWVLTLRRKRDKS